MRQMKRRDSILIALGAAAACGLLALGLKLALPGQSQTDPVTSPDPSAPAPTLQVTVSPAADQTAGPTPDAAPSPATGQTPSAKDPGLPTPTPSAEPTPAPVGVVADEGYDYSQCVPESAPAEDDYFSDAVFIGDSRTDGFRLYSGLTQGEYLVKTGLSVFKIEKDQVKVEGKKMTVPEALERKSYGKVYVCLGLNELGMYDDQGYYDHYAALIDRIRAAQPQAAVYIQLLIPVNEQKCAEKGVADYINNQQIGVYNGLLRQLAQDKRVFLTDPAQDIVDPATGQPSYDAVADGIHFQKGPYRQWLDYLKRHTVRLSESQSDPAPDQTWTPEETVASVTFAPPEVPQEEEPT